MTPPARTIGAAERLAVRGVGAIALLSLLCNVGVLAVPLFNMEVFNRVLPTRDTGTLVSICAGLAIGLAIYAVLDTLRGMALDALAGQFTRRLAMPLLGAVAASNRGAGGAAEALHDMEALRGFVASPASTAPFDAAWTPVLLLVLYALHWGFAALGVLCCAVLLGMNVLGDALSRREMLAANDASARALRQAADAVGAAEAVLGLGMLPTLRRRWEDGQARAAGTVHRAVLRARAVSAATNALRYGMTGAMVALGLLLALDGAASPGAMVASNMLLARLLTPFGAIAATRRQWVSALASWRRVRAALEHVQPTRYAHAMPAPAPRLVVENLTFMPPGADRPLLRTVSFTAEPGECVGVIGPSSAGKSTLVRVLLGMAAPTSGGAYLDGTSTYLWEREDFARHVGYVPQGVTLLDETVAANIARMAEPDMAAVLRAAKLAGAHRIIAGLPQGYSTVVRGGALSAGQRQRVAVARALYTRPGLLVLDEPSAFLDTDGEAELIALLARLRTEGVTVLLVTHRPALLAGADKLVVLQDGAVARYGARGEIMESLAAPPVRVLRAAS